MRKSGAAGRRYAAVSARTRGARLAVFAGLAASVGLVASVGLAVVATCVFPSTLVAQDDVQLDDIKKEIAEARDDADPELDDLQKRLDSIERSVMSGIQRGQSGGNRPAAAAVVPTMVPTDVPTAIPTDTSTPTPIPTSVLAIPPTEAFPPNPFRPKTAESAPGLAVPLDPSNIAPFPTEEPPEAIMPEVIPTEPPAVPTSVPTVYVAPTLPPATAVPTVEPEPELPLGPDPGQEPPTEVDLIDLPPLDPAVAPEAGVPPADEPDAVAHDAGGPLIGLSDDDAPDVVVPPGPTVDLTLCPPTVITVVVTATPIPTRTPRPRFTSSSPRPTPQVRTVVPRRPTLAPIMPPVTRPETSRREEAWADVVRPNATLRLNPGWNESRVTILNRGQSVRVVRRIDPWYQVKTKSGLVGWLHARDISIARVAQIEIIAKGDESPTDGAESALTADITPTPDPVESGS